MSLYILINLFLFLSLNNLFAQDISEHSLGDYLHKKTGEKCSYLDVKDLDLSSFVQDLTNIKLSLILGKFNNLEKLELKNAINLNSSETILSVARSIGNNGHNLNYLDISGCSNIEKDGFDYIFRSCRNLKVLKLSRCKNLCDDNLSTLAENCPKIEYLDLADCSELITDLGIIELSAKLENLKKINISNLINVTSTGINALKSKKVLIIKSFF